MTDNFDSGFLTDQEVISDFTFKFRDIEIIGESRIYVYAKAVRYGHRWMLKGLKRDAADSVVIQQQLLKEFEIHSGLNHPGIVRAVSLENVEGLGKCIVTEWIEGKTLSELLKSDKISEDLRRRLIHETVDAVAYLHGRGIVHRDLKPANIMVSDNGDKVKIIDFGCADTDGYSILKHPAGTPGYASKRQYEAFSPSVSDDIHSLGIIIGQISGRFSPITKRCLEGSRNQFKNGLEVLQAFERHQKNRKRLRLLSVALLAMTIIAGVAFMFSRMRATINELDKEVTTLQSRLKEVNDSSLTAKQDLTDSLTRISGLLKEESAYRINRETREMILNNHKKALTARINKAYASFRHREKNNAGTEDNNSLIRLIQALGKEKEDYLNHKVYGLSEKEIQELEYSFILRYNDILKEWQQQKK